MDVCKKVMAFGLGMALVLPAALAQTATPAANPHPHSINARERRQQKRIAQGIQSGQLTPKEAAKLERKEAAIERREDKMRASGGKFTPGERKAIQHQLNNESKQIYKQKHDAQQQH